MKVILLAYRTVATALFLAGIFTMNIYVLVCAYMVLSLHDAIMSNSK